MALTIDPDEMDMPCPCTNCGDYFDLHDGQGSEKWYPGTVLCSTCAQQEETEIETDEEIEDLKVELEEANWSLNDAQQTITRIEKRLRELA